MPKKNHPFQKFPVLLTLFLAMASTACTKPSPPVGADTPGSPPPSATPPAATPTSEAAATPVAEAAATPAGEGDLRAILEAALATESPEIVLPPGRYRVDPKNQHHLVLRGLKNRTIIADGVEMICTKNTRALTVEDCENVTLRGLTIDYDPLPYTQARIVEISGDARQLKVQVLTGYPPLRATSEKLEIFDPATNRLRGRITYYNTRCEPGENGSAILTKTTNTPPEANGERVGDIAVISLKPEKGQNPHAIYASSCKGLVLENVTLFTSNMFGFLENHCTGSTYKNCVVTRRPPETDFVTRELPRMRSLNADAFHSKNAEKGPQYEGCTAQFMGDDAIAINGDFHFVSHGEGKIWRVLAKRDMTMHAGDTVQIFTYDGHRISDRRILAITPAGTVTEEERHLLAEQQMDKNLKTTMITDAYDIELDEPESVPPGTLICSANRIGNGFGIRNCRLGFNRSRGILVKAGHGEIRDNHIEGSVMTAILISPEYWWMEAGLSDDLVISGNRIEQGGGLGIAVVAEGGNRTVAAAGTFQRITVTDNTVVGGAEPGLLLTSIRGLAESNNSIQPEPGKTIFPWQIGAWGKGGIEPVMRINVE